MNLNSGRYATHQVTHLLFSTVLVWSVVAASASAGPLTYDVGMITLDGGGPMPDYVVTGTITTNGTLGPLTASDIISWSVSVDGPRPYTFHPGNPGARVDPSFVFATLTALDTGGEEGWLWLHANENTLPNCSNCLQQLGWRSLISIGQLSYNFYDSGDGDPSFAPAEAPIGSPFSGKIPIAMRVPEPLGSSMAFLSAAILVSVLRTQTTPNLG